MIVDLYLTLCYGVRKPTFKITANGSDIIYKEKSKNKTGNLEEIIVSFEYLTDPDLPQCISVIHYGKTDQDLIIDNGKLVVDHYIKIEELEIDKIQFGINLLNATTFYHSMDANWIEDMKKQKIEILPSYCPGTSLNLNGRTDIKFTLPIWQWWCEKLQSYLI